MSYSSDTLLNGSLNRASNSWTMNALVYDDSSLHMKTSNSNWHPSTCIGAMRQNAQYTHSRIVFFSGLCSVDPNFPLILWDKLLSHATTTFNLLRQSRINPWMSAYAQLNGHYDFICATMAPPYTRVIADEKPDQRASWAPHGVDGWYTGLSLDHYRCYRIHVSDTLSERVVDTVELFPAHIKMSLTASKDLATTATQELMHVHPHPAPVPPSIPFA
jgi:hypothetical protein